MSAVRLEGMDRLQARLDRLMAVNEEAAAEAAAAGAEHVHRVMRTEFLNGQAIGRVDHALFNGWSVRKETRPPAGVLFTNIPYARAQEYGFRGEVQVRPYRRRRQLRRKTGESDRSFSRRRTAFQEGPSGGFDIQVAGHARDMNLRPRSFLRGAIEATRQSLRDIVLAVWRREIAE